MLCNTTQLIPQHNISLSKVAFVAPPTTKSSTSVPLLVLQQDMQALKDFASLASFTKYIKTTMILKQSCSSHILTENNISFAQALTCISFSYNLVTASNRSLPIPCIANSPFQSKFSILLMENKAPFLYLSYMLKYKLFNPHFFSLSTHTHSYSVLTTISQNVIWYLPIIFFVPLPFYKAPTNALFQLLGISFFTCIE